MCFFVAPFVNYDLRYRCFILEQILPKGPDRQIATSCDVNLREKKNDRRKIYLVFLSARVS